MSDVVDKWIADACDYAEVHKGYKHRELDAMVSRLFREEPWDQDPIDWVDEFHRGRFPEDI